MDKQWTSIFLEEIEGLKNTMDMFDKGELDRKAYKGIVTYGS